MPNIVSRRRAALFVRSGMLLLAMAAVLATVGWLLLGLEGVLLSFGLALLFAMVSPGITPERLMRAQGARPLHPSEAPWLFDTVSDLARRAGLSRAPVVYLLPLPIPQAMATRDGERAAVGVSGALLRALGPREVAGVLAHEMSHLVSGDLGVMRLAQTVWRMTRSMTTFGILLLFFNLPLFMLGAVHVPWLAVLVLLFAPWAVGALSLALSRSRELDADLGAVSLTGDPLSLANALSKIEASTRLPSWLSIFRIDVPDSLRTHPRTEERVARLLAMAHGPVPRRARRRPGEVIEPIWRKRAS